MIDGGYRQDVSRVHCSCLHLFSSAMPNGKSYSTSYAKVAYYTGKCSTCSKVLPSEVPVLKTETGASFPRDVVSVCVATNGDTYVCGLTGECLCDIISLGNLWTDFYDIIDSEHCMSIFAFLLDYLKCTSCQKCIENSFLRQYMQLYVNLEGHKSLQFLQYGGLVGQKIADTSIVRDRDMHFGLIEK